MFYTVIVEVILGEDPYSFTYFKKDYADKGIAWKSFWQIERALEHAGYGYRNCEWSSEDPDASQTMSLWTDDGGPLIKISRLVSNFADDEADSLDCVKVYCDINDYITGLSTGHPSSEPSYDDEADDCNIALSNAILRRYDAAEADDCNIAL